MKFLIFLTLIEIIFIVKSTGNEILTTENVENSTKYQNLEAERKDEHDKETQMAQCTVSSGDIKASAQATFSVKGFCLSRDMEKLKETLYDIESRLLREIYQLRVMIERTLPPGQQYNTRNDYNPNYRQYTPYRNEQVHRQNQPVQTTETIKNSITQSILLTTTTAASTTTTKLPSINTFLKSLESSKSKAKQKSLDVPLQSKNEYIFYWKLDKFPKEFLHAKKNEIFSHVFNVKGLFLRIRAVLKFEENKSLFMDVEHLANVDNSEKMEIEVSDGSELVFMEIAEEKLFQFSFVILDQKVNNHDLISPVYWNTDSDGFLISDSVHVLSNYLKNDTLLIKLIISF